MLERRERRSPRRRLAPGSALFTMMPGGMGSRNGGAGWAGARAGGSRSPRGRRLRLAPSRPAVEPLDQTGRGRGGEVPCRRHAPLQEKILRLVIGSEDHVRERESKDEARDPHVSGGVGV